MQSLPNCATVVEHARVFCAPVRRDVTWRELDRWLGRLAQFMSGLTWSQLSRCLIIQKRVLQPTKLVEDCSAVVKGLYWDSEPQDSAFAPRLCKTRNGHTGNYLKVGRVDLECSRQILQRHVPFALLTSHKCLQVKATLSCQLYTRERTCLRRQ